MIDKENEVYSRVRDAILKKFPNASVSSLYVKSPARFPHVTVIQTDSYEPVEYRDSSMEEKLTAITFNIDVYSNKNGTAKSECKEIMNIADNAMKSMNFRRESLSQIPNIKDATIFRMVGQYQAVVDNNNFYTA